jgi:hypothetical protein
MRRNEIFYLTTLQRYCIVTPPGTTQPRVTPFDQVVMVGPSLTRGGCAKVAFLAWRTSRQTGIASDTNKII